MFGRALSWGSAFAVCIVHCSLVYQFEHSGKVRRAWFKFGFENFYSSLLSGSASFLCAALMSPPRTKQYCPQIEYIYIYIYIYMYFLQNWRASSATKYSDIYMRYDTQFHLLIVHDKIRVSMSRSALLLTFNPRLRLQN